MLKKYVTTFGGSEFRSDTPQYLEAERLGRLLANRGYIVKCGGYYGLMEAVCKGVFEFGGICIGVTNASFDPKQKNKYVTEERKQKDIFDRLRELVSESEIFVFQEGSIGTLEELFVVWCLRYTLTMKNIRICLIGKFWFPFLAGVENLAIKPEEFEVLEVYDSLEDFKKKL